MNGGTETQRITKFEYVLRMQVCTHQVLINSVKVNTAELFFYNAIIHFLKV
jgi:hypothetical protein